MEATEIEEYATLLGFTNWDPSPIIGRKYAKTEDNSEMNGQPDSNVDDSFSLLNSSELEVTSDDNLFFISTPKTMDKAYIMPRREEAVPGKEVNEESTEPPVKNSKCKDGPGDLSKTHLCYVGPSVKSKEERKKLPDSLRKGYLLKTEP